MKNLTLQKFLCELFKFPNLQYMYMIVCIKFLYRLMGWRSFVYCAGSVTLMWPSLSGSWPWSHSCLSSRTLHQGEGRQSPDQIFLMCPVALLKNSIWTLSQGKLGPHWSCCNYLLPTSHWNICLKVNCVVSDLICSLDLMQLPYSWVDWCWKSS